MKNTTRKRIWSMSLVMSIAIIGALAAFVVLANNPGSTAAHGGAVENHCDDLASHGGPFQDAGIEQHDEDWATNSSGPHTCADGSGNPDDTSGTGNGGTDPADTGVAPLEGLEVEYTADEIVVSWDAVDDADHYVVSYGECMHNVASCGADTVSMTVSDGDDDDDAPDTTAMISRDDLDAGALHEIRVTANGVNAAGATTALAESSLICPAEEPMDFSVVALDNGGRLTWEKPGGSHAGEIVGYQISREVYHENAQIRRLLQQNGGDAEFDAIGLEQMHWDLGLSYGATYTYWVRAKMEVPVTDGETIVGYGLWSKPRTIIVADSGGRLDPIPVKPSVPQSVTATFNDPSDNMCAPKSVTITWEAPDRNGREGADSNGEYVGGDFIGGDNAGRVILGKEATIKYYNVLRREGGTGPWSKIASNLTPATVNIFTDMSEGLDFGKTYEYQVEVVNSAPLSNSATVELTIRDGEAEPDKPGEPQSLIVVILDDGTVELQWDPPAEGQNADTAPLLTYEIRRQSATSDGWDDLPSQPHQSSDNGIAVVRTQEYGDNLVVSDAVLGEIQTYQVRAVLRHANDACVTSASDWVEADSNVEAPNVPDQVTGLTAGTPTQTEVTLSWMAPNANRSGITGYTLERGTGGQFVDVFTGNDLMYTDTGLMAGTTYEYRVSATNQLGNSEPSATLEVITASEAPMLTRPTNVVAAAVGGTVNVTWNNGMNAASHLALLLDGSDYSLAMPAATAQTDGQTMFQNVPAGSYIVVVVAIESASSYLYDTATVQVGQ